MTKPVDPKEAVIFEEMYLSSMYETAEIVEVLEEKGILTKQEVIDKIMELKRRMAGVEVVEFRVEPVVTQPAPPGRIAARAPVGRELPTCTLSVCTAGS
jgi:hypothetical protein